MIPGGTLSVLTVWQTSTGLAADATGDPTGALYINGVLSGQTVTVTKPTGTGIYKYSVVLPLTIAPGDSIAIISTATVSTVAQAKVVFQHHGALKTDEHGGVNMTMFKNEPARNAINSLR